MAKIVVLGAGIAGHTAATHLRRKLSKEHEVLVVSPNSNYQWVPSNIWVGIGRMTPKEITFPLAPLYQKHGIGYKRKAVLAQYTNPVEIKLMQAVKKALDPKNILNPGKVIDVE